MNWLDFQSLAVTRLHDATALYTTGRYACAYYIAGYAIECALKACIARKTQEHEFPPREAPRFYTHDLAKLLEISGLAFALANDIRKDEILGEKWAIVKEWSEESRYQDRRQQQLEDLLAAIADDQHGIFQWLKRNW